MSHDIFLTTCRFCLFLFLPKTLLSRSMITSFHNLKLILLGEHKKLDWNANNQTVFVLCLLVLTRSLVNAGSFYQSKTCEVPKSATNLAPDVWNENDGRTNSLVKLRVGIVIDSFFSQIKNVINLSSSFSMVVHNWIFLTYSMLIKIESG